jgi:hypothetical protein
VFRVCQRPQGLPGSARIGAGSEKNGIKVLAPELQRAILKPSNGNRVLMIGWTTYTRGKSKTIILRKGTVMSISFFL